MNKTILFIFLFLITLTFSCQGPAPKNRLTPEQQAKLITRGKTITMLSFKAFSKELMKALNEGGVKYAVGYCHLKASPLVDSLSKVHKVKISRISDKFRNPANKPGDLDLEVITTYQNQLANGDELQPHLEMNGDEVIFYSPILILNPVCLNCHGEPGSTMEQENFDFIKSKYPDDLAYGYNLGDLRGVWRIVLSPE
jgi:hypothetical protein